MKILWRNILYYRKTFMNIVKECINSLLFISGGKG